MNDLFPVPESLSPRMKWMKEHGIKTHCYQDQYPGSTEDEFGNEMGRWSAWIGQDENFKCSGVGETEEEALWQLSQNLGIKFWK